MVGREETQRKLDPVLGDAPVNARIDLADLHSEPFLEPLHLRFADPGFGECVLAPDIEQDLLGPREILVEMQRQPDLVPDVREVVRVIINGAVEHLVVGDA